MGKGFSKKKGVDYHKVFSPIVKHTSIRLILSVAILYDMKVEQMHVTTTFLHEKLEEQIFME